MPLAGFKCPKGRNEGRVPFSFCETDCPERCYPLPLLMSFAGDREIIPKMYSVTELVKPRQQVYYSRNFDYWVSPESQVWLTFGTGIHKAIEMGYDRIQNKNNHIIEKRCEVSLQTPMGVAVLRGTPDHVDLTENTLYDYKSSGSFQVKKLWQAVMDGATWLEEDYFIQLNVYRAFFYPTISRLRLVCLVKDWTTRMTGEMNRIEFVEVPVANVEDVKVWAIDRISTFMLDELNPGSIAKCGPKDTWDGRRCREYCNAADVCPQFKGGTKVRGGNDG